MPPRNRPTAKTATGPSAAALRRGTSKAETTRDGRPRTASTPGPKPGSRRSEPEPDHVQHATDTTAETLEQAVLRDPEAMSAIAAARSRTLGEVLDSLGWVAHPSPDQLRQLRRAIVIGISDIPGVPFSEQQFTTVTLGLDNKDVLWSLHVAIQTTTDRQAHKDIVQQQMLNQF